MLVVDDDRAIAMMLSASLRTMGTVDTASTVDAAAAQLCDHNYDAAVVDMVLDGDATALRNALEARGIPVLLVSGRDGERLQREANEHGWRFLAKPFTQEQVMRELSAMLDLDDAPDNQATPSSPTITQPPPTPANHQPEPTTRKPTAVDLIDRLADIVGMACIVALAWRDKIDGTVALGGILGVGTVLYALLIGPVVQLFLPVLTVRVQPPEPRGLRPQRPEAAVTEPAAG